MRTKCKSSMSHGDFILSNGLWKKLFNINNFDTVKSINLIHNELTTDKVISFPSIIRLESLNLSDNYIDSSLDLGSVLEKYPQLRNLFMTNNKLTDECIIKVNGAGGNIFKDTKYIVLELLNLSKNKLQRISFDTELPLLQILDLSENLIKNIKGLGNLRYLTSLNLSNNQLTSLPHDLFILQSLEKLNASFNEIQRYINNNEE